MTYAEPVQMFAHTFTEPTPATDLVPLAKVPTLAEILRLEGYLASCPQVEIEAIHHFAEGLYSREVTVPKGTYVTGKMHRHQHMNFITKGDITVWTEEGMKRIKAPAMLISEPGTKRVAYAHEDTTWICVHATHETDLVALEAELIVPEQEVLALATEMRNGLGDGRHGSGGTGHVGLFGQPAEEGRARGG